MQKGQCANSSRLGAPVHAFTVHTRCHQQSAAQAHLRVSMKVLCTPTLAYCEDRRMLRNEIADENSSHHVLRISHEQAASAPEGRAGCHRLFLLCDAALAGLEAQLKVSSQRTCESSCTPEAIYLVACHGQLQQCYGPTKASLQYNARAFPAKGPDRTLPFVEVLPDESICLPLFVGQHSCRVPASGCDMPC
jgi:hypothetical protein